ncbi:type II toxin-antitoxin system PrlF family antitoxin [Methanobrevibacter arboriphilus]|uniref:type II toxin-antitoxin system PrlF family antitoxin n=1 Tax=Methanobrevibacter arboriphilus TaxID=39441 RepID=UPI000A4E6C74|nr:type II toxin-antitoxin system PrlF family antitoxin [Methanobrevibacter arboriphilus]
MIKAETNIYDKFQTVIPKKIREKLGLTKDHVIEWIADENGKVELKFRKKIN